MRKTLVFCFLLLMCWAMTAQNCPTALIPMPNHLEILQESPFQVAEDKTVIVLEHGGLEFEARQLAEIFQQRMGITLPIQQHRSKAAIHLCIDEHLDGNEHYVLEVSSKEIWLKGATAAAVFRGIMTLDQWLLGEVCTTAQHQVAAMRIDDEPRFEYRALMLDPARHFLPVKDVKFYIDQMVRYKYNVLQMHLTDDQGWRMEIKSHPKLASKQHYSQSELRELTDYAAQRHVMLVPEIDVPGHTVSVLAAYPELSCKHLQGCPMEVGKTVNRMLCAANPKTYAILEDIFSEVCEVFEAPYVHLGGDEAAVPANWAKCPDCQALMSQKGYSEPTHLMIPFFHSVLDNVRQGGKHPILWCELNNIYPPADDYLFPYPQDVTLVSWRNGLTPTCLQLTAKHGNPIIMAPGEHAYLDYPQWKGDLPEHLNWGMPITSLEQTYRLDPGYGVADKDQQHVLGVMGTLWGEAICDIHRATYMTYPRALALAEAGWTEMEHRSWESFKERLYPNLLLLMKSGVSFRVPFEIVK